MSVPEIVRSTLGEEEIVATVRLGGEDAVYVTPSRTLCYRDEGLLSDETVNEYPHDAERVSVSEGRRKSKLALEYGLGGTRTITVPQGSLEDVLHLVLAGVLNAAGVTDAGETVIQTYRFSELTLVITSDRVVKHIGEAVWDEDYDEYHYGDVTGLSFEDGSVAMQVVISVDGRPQRIKAPNDRARELREQLERAMFAYHDVRTREEFEALVTPDDDDEPTSAGRNDLTFGSGIEPLTANPPRLDDEGNVTDGPGATEGDASNPAADATASASRPGDAPPSTSDDRDGPADDRWQFEDSGFEPAAQSAEGDDVAAELAALREAIDRQNQLLAAQTETIEQLIDELSRGR